jgi:hypothetical protein
MKPRLHDVLGASVACKDTSPLTSFDDAFSIGRELIERRFEGVLVDLLVGMRLLDGRKGSSRWNLSVMSGMVMVEPSTTY